MDFDQLKEVWKKAEHRSVNDTDKELNLKLQTVTGTQQKIRQYVRFEMVVAVTAVLIFGILVYFSGDLEPYFYKLFALILLGSLPINIRLFLSLKRILGIDYTQQLKKNIVAAKNHLKATLRIYYTLVVLTVIALVMMSWWDDFFLQLPIVWQVGVMGYFLIFLIVSIFLIKKYYGSRLKELETLAENL
ncbi:hypothetical protein [Rhodonellum sp.]|uniref:hypothetical protein n=1 Tax=Rhodonellum sp. TaxID=2231180 RepID=UPI002728F14B|nr:hypothetical protein [Rhodonellum sp.]MDO9552227.1 hypothetical protein [Rhodonellum sp.]